MENLFTLLKSIPIKGEVSKMIVTALNNNQHEALMQFLKDQKIVAPRELETIVGATAFKLIP